MIRAGARLPWLASARVRGLARLTPALTEELCRLSQHQSRQHCSLSSPLQFPSSLSTILPRGPASDYLSDSSFLLLSASRPCLQARLPLAIPPIICFSVCTMKLTLAQLANHDDILTDALVDNVRSLFFSNWLAPF